MAFSAGQRPYKLYARKLVAGALMTIIFGGVGLLLLVLAGTVGQGPVLWIIGGVFALIGLFCLATFIGMVRERLEIGRDADRPLPQVQPGRPLPAPTTRAHPWEWEDLARAIATAFEGSPYAVHADDRVISIGADLTHRRWRKKIRGSDDFTSFVATLTRRRPGVARRNDVLRHVDRGTDRPELGPIAAVSSGRSWVWKRTSTYTLGEKGFTETDRITFSTSDINRPLDEVCRAAGWRQTLDAESKGAVVIAVLGASSIIVAPVGLLIKHLSSG